MNKIDLIDAIATETGTTKVAAAAALEAATDAITNAVSKGSDVNIAGFGKFTRSTRAARTGRNPKTGAAIAIDASHGVKFSASKGLKDALNA